MLNIKHWITKMNNINMMCTNKLIFSLFVPNVFTIVNANILAIVAITNGIVMSLS
ncbi:hypothetical protein RCZ01_06440 [Capnocytophaga felis]|uniref:Uncharacterized protein n=1 Tax=Capnocytophaga felis TaxID=2267611 RepID=A0A5M4B7X2_9FLAO|nr:hypothetical protein RCZ01_06440 [Capnocytophaga felis]GET47495.1 hypothetical protein RCZ02_03260 [Capnocytophaga felis]